MLWFFLILLVVGSYVGWNLYADHRHAVGSKHQRCLESIYKLERELFPDIPDGMEWVVCRKPNGNIYKGAFPDSIYTYSSWENLPIEDEKPPHSIEAKDYALQSEEDFMRTPRAEFFAPKTCTTTKVEGHRTYVYAPYGALKSQARNDWVGEPQNNIGYLIQKYYRPGWRLDLVALGLTENSALWRLLEDREACEPVQPNATIGAMVERTLEEWKREELL